MSDEPRINVAVLFPAKLHRELSNAAAAADLSLAQLVRKLAREYVDAENAQTNNTCTTHAHRV